MIIYRGKAKDLSYKMLLWNVYFQLAKPVESLESGDFSLN